MSVADDFNTKLEDTIAIALKESWDKNNQDLQAMGYGSPTDSQFKKWAGELIKDRSISFVNPDDPKGDPIRLDMEALQTTISENPAAQKALKDKFETDELDKIIPTAEQQAKTGKALESAKESSGGLLAMIFNVIMGLVDWVMGGFQSGQDGSIVSGITESIARRGANNFAKETSSLLEEQVPDMHPGVRKYIVNEAQKEAERIGIPSNVPERTLADVVLGEKVAVPASAPEAAPAAEKPAAPAVEPEKPVVSQAPAAAQNKLQGVVQNIIKEILVKNKVEGKQMVDALEKATPLVMKTLNDNADMVKKGDFDTLASTAAQNLLDDKEIGKILRDKALELYKTRLIASDARIKNKLVGDIKEELNGVIRAQLQSNLTDKVATAGISGGVEQQADPQLQTALAAARSGSKGMSRGGDPARTLDGGPGSQPNPFA